MTRYIIYILLFLPVHLWSQGQAYLIPDLGTSGYNTQVEIIANHSQFSTFGPDGFYLNNPESYVRVFCTHPEDSNKVVISPLVVSWHGRLITTQIFVKPHIQSNSNIWHQLDAEFKIPISIEVNDIQANIDTFYIVQPQPDFYSNSPEVIGNSLNSLRSRRGAIIFESFTLEGNGEYTFSTVDCDPYSEGNQAYLPVHLIALDSIYVSPQSSINMSANGKNAAPGGGGGGAGSRSGDGGHGYTAGGFSCKVNASTPNYSGESTGYIIPPEENDSLLMGNYSLNGVKGGIGYCDQGAGGGTGHPFGSSGRMGPVGIQTPQPGGYGAGSAGGEESISNPPTYGGGGGGNASEGEMGGGNASSNGGKIHGNKQISPLFGGSGGGAGNVWALNQGGSGGGGGGSIALFSFGKLELEGNILANGGNGGNGVDLYAPLNTCSGGGGGAGGTIIVGSKCQNLGSGAIQVDGGSKGLSSGNGSDSNEGGDGGSGRFRQDGKTTNSYNLNTLNASEFEGPSSYFYTEANTNFTLHGKGSGEAINVYVKEEYGTWYLHETINSYVDNWSSDITLSDAAIHYFAITQSNNTALVDTFKYQATETFSQTAANMVYINLKPVANNDTVQLLENTSLLISNQSNDYDPNNSPLITLIVEDCNFGVSSVENDTSILYTPNTNYNGYDTIVYAIRDTGIVPKYDTATIFIHVLEENSAPVIQDNGNPVDTLWYSTLSNESFEICTEAIDYELNDVDLTHYQSISNNGTVDLLPYGDTCAVYQPNLNFDGQDTLMIWLCDDGIPILCDSVVVIVEVIPINHPPDIVESGNPVDTIYLSVDENDSLEICFEVHELDNDSIIISNILTTSNGTYSDEILNDTCLWYLPIADYYGTDTLWVDICEDPAYQNDPLCDSIVVIIDVVPVNYPPEIVELGNPIDTIYLSVDENDSLEICFEVFEPDSDSIMISNVSTTGNGEYSDESINDTCLWYHPISDYYGNDTLWVDICDMPITPSEVLCDSIVVIIDVLPVNYPPEIVELSNPIDTIYLSVDENDSLEICFEVIDQDNDSIVISQVVTTNNGYYSDENLNDTCIWYHPISDYSGSDTLWVEICDEPTTAVEALCDSVVVIIDVIPANNAPDIIASGSPIDTLYLSVNENDSLEICFEVLEEDNDSIMIGNILTTSNGYYSNNNINDTCLWYYPISDYFGNDTLWIDICDNRAETLCDSIVVIIDVIPVNYPPEILESSSPVDTLYFTINENDSLEFCFEVFEPDNDSISISQITATNNGNYSDESISDTCFSYWPITAYTGSDTLWVQICDNPIVPNDALCDSVVLIIDVLPINHPPTAIVDTILIKQRETIVIDLLTNDYDSDQDSIYFDSIHEPFFGSLVSYGNGEISYTADDEYVGAEVVPYKICDIHENSLCDSSYVLIITKLRTEIIVPTGFSPNGDMINDVFYIEGIKPYKKVHLTIFNRWGNIIYESTNYKNDWDGQYENANAQNMYYDRKVPNGTYYYVLKIAAIEFTKNGFFILKK